MSQQAMRSHPAFAAPISMNTTVLSRPSAPLTSRFVSSVRCVPRARRARMGPVMDASSQEEESVSLTDKSTDASAILKEMRKQAAAEGGPRTLNTGVTRDQDGKSNVWAVEPTINIDEKEPVNKAAILGVVMVAVVFALIFLPKLPFVNGDQF